MLSPGVLHSRLQITCKCRSPEFSEGRESARLTNFNIFSQSSTEQKACSHATALLPLSRSPVEMAGCSSHPRLFCTTHSFLMYWLRSDRRTREVRMTRENARHTGKRTNPKNKNPHKVKAPLQPFTRANSIIDGVSRETRLSDAFLPIVGGSIIGHSRLAFRAKATKVTHIRAL